MGTQAAGDCLRVDQRIAASAERIVRAEGRREAGGRGGGGEHQSHSLQQVVHQLHPSEPPASQEVAQIPRGVRDFQYQ